MAHPHEKVKRPARAHPKKTPMLGPARKRSSARPTPRNRNNRSLATPKIFRSRVGAKDGKDTYHFSERYKKRRESEKTKTHRYMCVSEQTNKKSDKKHRRKFLSGLKVHPHERCGRVCARTPRRGSYGGTLRAFSFLVEKVRTQHGVVW